MEWYVLNYDFNSKNAELYNIFNSSKFSDGLKEINESNYDFDEFVEELDKLCRYCFWSKSEYEIYVTDAFHPEDQSKIDVYDQLKPNMKVLAEYIINNR